MSQILTDLRLQILAAIHDLTRLDNALVMAEDCGEGNIDLGPRYDPKIHEHLENAEIGMGLIRDGIQDLIGYPRCWQCNKLEACDVPIHALKGLPICETCFDGLQHPPDKLTPFAELPVYFNPLGIPTVKL